jgi:TrmH family RNA methyltransferase
MGGASAPEGMRSPLYNEPLHPDSERDRVEIVLVSPRNPLNIGAAARAMANFGFTRLTVVAPPEADSDFDARWRETRSAIGAGEILERAKVAESVAEAVAECTLVLGTGSLEWRKPEQPVVPLPELGPRLREEFARGGRIALIFGPEKRGLTRDDLARCHALAEIPTDPHQPSMNLGQAVAVCLYEIAARLDENKGEHELRPTIDQTQSGDAASPPAASARLELLAEVVEETMIAADYSPAAMRSANRHDLELLLRRLKITEPDARRILGLFRRVLYRLKQ